MRIVKRFGFASKWVAAGIAITVLASAGTLFADDEKKKPTPKAAAAAHEAPAATPAPAPAPARTPRSATPAESTPGAGHSRRPEAPAGQSNGGSTVPAGRPDRGTTRPGNEGTPPVQTGNPNRPVRNTPTESNTPAVTPGRPGYTNPAGGRYGNTGGISPERSNPGAGSRTPPVGGRQFGGARPVAGSVRAPEYHGNHAVYRSPSGQKAYERKLPDGRRVYADGRGRGLIERQYVYRGHPVYQRVYYVNGVSYPRYYNSYSYGGVSLMIYTPARYYSPAFYGWAYDPWGAPIAYSWGFRSSPWYGYYGGYFTPYPVYASPSLWLTDYMIANTLEQSYQAQAQQQQMMQQSYAAPLTPGIKQQISEEVRRQIQLEQSERQAAQSGLPDAASSSVAMMLQDNMSHVFLVSSPLNAGSAAGQCPVTEGDVLQMGPPQTPNADYANVIVLASKGQDCPRGSMVTVGVADLQEMQNSMRQNIDQGMATLQANQGQGGIPALPAGANAPPSDAAYAQAAPPPDPNGAQQVTQEWAAGNTAEQEPPGPDNNGQPAPIQQQAQPAQIGLGMSLEEVEASQGRPTTILSPSSTKKIYIYQNFKVTFTNGKVTDIQ